MTTKTALPAQQRTPNRARGRDYILPACVALACADEANVQVQAMGPPGKAFGAEPPIRSPMVTLMNRRTGIARKAAAGRRR